MHPAVGETEIAFHEPLFWFILGLVAMAELPHLNRPGCRNYNETLALSGAKMHLGNPKFKKRAEQPGGFIAPLGGVRNAMK